MKGRLAWRFNCPTTETRNRIVAAQEKFTKVNVIAMHPPTGSLHVEDRPLLRDVRLLRWELNQVLERHGSENLATQVRRLRELAARRRNGDPLAAQAMTEETARTCLDDLHQLIRVQGCYLDLVNLAEDRQRLRVLRRREATRYPVPRRESVGAAIDTLKAMEWSTERVQEFLDLLQISPVFTAHPTEAKRATIRQALRRLRQRLRDLDRQDTSRHEREMLLENIQSDLACLWETDAVRPRRPTVLEEVHRNMVIVDTLWEVVPRLYYDLRTALRRNYGEHRFRIPRLLRFGTWIGGDRDGNPFVTADVTRQTLLALRREAIGRHLAACAELASHLSVSDRYHPIGAAMAEAIRQARIALERGRAVDRDVPSARAVPALARGDPPSAGGYGGGRSGSDSPRPGVPEFRRVCIATQR